MSFGQNTLIYIEENDKIEASIAARGFAEEEVKNRAYINALGAELALKYLSSENIDVSNIHNLHTIKKVLEETDISDIMLPNIHIDVRVIFDENFIFIPKSHFEYNLVPDVYFVFSLAQDITHVKFLGFFEPNLINKNNQNEQYYFIEKEKLTPPVNLKAYIQGFNGNTMHNLSETEMESYEKIMISMVDNDISEDDKKHLLQQLTKSSELRDKFIEYENFELLSISAINDNEIQKLENNQSSITDYLPEIIEDVVDEFSTENNILPINNEDFFTSDLEDIPEINDMLSDLNENESNSEEFMATESQTEEKSEQIETYQENNILDDITALGAAEALGFAAGAAAAEASDTMTNIIDSAELVKDGLEIAEKGIDLAANLMENLIPESVEIIDTAEENNNIEPEEIELEISETPEDIDNFTISDISDINPSDAIDNSPENEIIESIEKLTNMEDSYSDINTNIELSEDSCTIEPLSLDDIETSYNEETAFQEEISTDTISFDSIDTQEIEDTNTDDLSLENSISIENIDVPEIETFETDISIESNSNTMSFDYIDTTQVENNTFDYIDEVDNKISLDNIENVDIDETYNEALDNVDSEPMSFDSIDTQEIEETNTDDLSLENSISLEDVDVPEFETFETDTYIESNNDTMSFDNIETLESKIDEETLDNDFLDDSMSFDDNDIEVIDILDKNNTSDNDAESAKIEDKQESFGKNLIDGLSADNLDNISIEGLNDDIQENTIIQNAENISSNDLLAEIDDILNTSELSGELENNIESPDNKIEDILGVKSLSEINTENYEEENEILDEIPELNQYFEQIAETENETPDDEIVSLIDNIETNYISNSDNEPTPESADSLSENDEKLGLLFNDNDDSIDKDDIGALAEFDSDYIAEEQELPSTPGAALFKNQKTANPNNKKNMIAAAAIVAVLVSVSAFAFLKSKNNNTDLDTIAKSTAETEILDTNVPSQGPLPTEEVTSNDPIDVQTNVLTNAPDINSIDKKEIQKPQKPKELKNPATPQKQKPISSESYLTVQKLTWDVPDYLSYSNKMKNYLMTAGKSIKLSLSADLLLATEYAYSNQVKVNLKLGADGSVQDANVVASSGSGQIDKIVLQSVKDTLNVVKPPSGEVKGQNFNLSLIIYF